MNITSDSFCAILYQPLYRFAVNNWKNRSNSDIKRMIEQNGVRLLRDKETIPINLNTEMGLLEQGDLIVFGRFKDINRVMIEVMSTAKFEPSTMTVYKWIIDNKERLCNERY